jgi:periplasmic copper chaperone A
MMRAFAALALGLTSFALTGCEKPAYKTAEGAASPAVAAAAGTGIDGLSVSDAHLAMPAVSGNPAGLFFELSYSGQGGLALESAAIAQAKTTMMHDVAVRDGMTQMVPLGSLTIEAGDTVAFAPGGKHIMAMQLDDAVAPGGKVDVTLTFAGGKTAKFKADVLTAGEMKMEH